MTAGAVISSASGSIVQAALYDASTVYGAVMYRGGFGASLGLLDNYSITTSAIPEPSTFAVVAGLGALGLVSLRRRCST